MISCFVSKDKFYYLVMLLIVGLGQHSDGLLTLRMCSLRIHKKISLIGLGHVCGGSSVCFLPVSSSIK